MFLQVIASIATLGLIYLIINRIMRNLKHFTKSVINLGIGVILGGVIYLAYYLDTKNNMSLEPKYYLLFFFGSIGWGLVCFVFYLIKAMTERGTFHRGHIKSEKKKEYLYVVFNRGLDVYLEKGKLKGIIIKIKEKDFHDEKILSLAKSYAVLTNSDNIKKIGEAIIIGDVNTVYHCYNVKLIDEVKESSHLDKIDKRNITSIDFDKLDKQIIFRTLLEENFVIKFEKKEIGD